MTTPSRPTSASGLTERRGLARRFFTAPIVLLLLVTGGSASVLQDAMRDELDRTIRELTMEDMPSPYYISYRVEDEWSTTVDGWFGAVASSDHSHSRTLYVNLRVGSPELDNSNFASGSYLGFGPGLDDAPLPTDDDYDALRNAIWLATDVAYKDALELLSRKKALLEDRLGDEELPDFVQVPSTIHHEPLEKPLARREQAEALVSELSGVFREFETIQYSTVRLTARLRQRHFMDSDGSTHIASTPHACLKVYAYAQASDGEEIRDWITLTTRSVEDLPPMIVLRQRVADFARQVCETQAAPKATEDYVGPVLLKGVASPQVFYEVIGRGVSDPRRPLLDDEGLEESYTPVAGFLAGKLGRKLLPQFFSAYDDPTMDEWEAAPLVGTFPVDEQGVAALRVPLVESGRLVGLLMNRAPTKEVPSPNGHARSLDGAPVGLIGNLVMTSDETEEDLEGVFRQLLEPEGLEYGMVIERLGGELPPEQKWHLSLALVGREWGVPEELLSEPLYAYRLYADGRTEVVRGLAFEDVTYRMLRDIVVAGSVPVVHNIILEGHFGREQPATVIAPEVIIDEVALKVAHPQPLKLPVVPHPYFD
jgi:predicted Zn-dependent protease